MKTITITSIPQGQPHRHGLPDVDDYYYGPDGELRVVVTECDDPRDTMLIAIHAVVEAIINEHLGVTPEMVDEFDAGVPLGDDSPGDKPECPYFLSHQAAKIAEEAAGMVFKRVFKSVREKSI